MTDAIGGYSFTPFLPIILKDSLNFSQELSFILNTPPVIFSILVRYGFSWLADKTHMRGPYIVVEGVLALVGFVLEGFLTNPWGRYVGSLCEYPLSCRRLMNLGVFIGYCGVNGFVVTSLAWQRINIRGDAKTSVATAITFMMSGIGGIYSSLVFRQQVSTTSLAENPFSDISGFSMIYSGCHCCLSAFGCHYISGNFHISSFEKAKYGS